LHQLQQAIAPQLELGFVLGHWNEIAAALAEKDRERVPQLAVCHILS
jgi:predicted nucleic acid-binding Zn ribbon protein